MNGQLSGSSRSACDTVLRHPAARNVGRDVGSMLGWLAKAVPEPNGNLKVIGNGQTPVLHASLNANLY